MTVAPRKPLFSSGYQPDILICLGLVLAIFIPYRQVAGHSFVDFDDGLYTFQNTYIIKGLSWDSVCWAFSNTFAANWHPLTWISHLVDRELFGPHAGGYLLDKCGRHAIASCLCYVAFRKTTGDRLFGFIIALFFAVHPANVENVAWASERKSILDAVFWFCAIITYLDFIKTRSFRAYGVTAIAHLLGLMCKAMSVTLPFTLILIHILYLVYHPDRRDSPLGVWPWVKKLLLPVVPLLLISLCFCVVTIWAQSIAMPPAEYPIGNRIINMLLSYESYLAMFFHPNRLAIFYPLFISDLTFRATISAILVLCAISIVAILLARSAPQFLIGWCWFLGTMVPAVGLVQVGSQSHADRYLYIPMLGLAFLFPVLFDALRPVGISVWRTVTGTSLAVLGVSMILATQIQVSYWKDSITLFSHSLTVTGDCVTSTINLGIGYVRSERYQEAIAFADSKIAVATNPVNKGRLAAIKGEALIKMEKHESAAEWAKKAVDWGDTDSFPLWILAMANYKLGKTDEAIRWLHMAQSAKKPVDKVNYVSVRADINMDILEKLLKSQNVKKDGPAKPLVQPACPGPGDGKPASSKEMPPNGPAKRIPAPPE